MSEKQVKKASKKKVALIVALVCAGIVVLSLLTASLDPAALAKRWFGKEQAPDQQIDFYPINEDEDILAREDYLGLDRYVYYTDPMTGETFVPERHELAIVDAALPFFYDYLDCIIRGDEATYPLYFSTAYLESNELPADFTMQMLYDMRIEPYATEDETPAYLLEYKIYRNNGTFRRDIGSNAARTLLVFLTYEQGTPCIDAMQPYTGY